MRKDEFFDLIGDIEERKIAEAGMVMKKAKRPVWIKWSAIVACSVLVIAVSIPIINHFSLTQGRGVQPGGNPNGYTTLLDDNFIQSDNDPEVSMPAKTTQLLVNELESPPASADMDVQYSFYDKLPEKVWRTVLEEFHEFVGINYEDFIVRVPNTWNFTRFYSLSTRGYKETGLDEEYSLHDYVFDYQTDSGGKATIAICTFEQPLRDYFIVCDNPELSKINEVSLVIYGYKDLYMVQFAYQNVNYDIETTNITLEELENLLSGLLTVSVLVSNQETAD